MVSSIDWNSASCHSVPASGPGCSAAEVTEATSSASVEDTAMNSLLKKQECSFLIELLQQRESGNPKNNGSRWTRTLQPYYQPTKKSDQKATLHELADRYGVSAERIRQIEKSAMNRLKSQLAA